MEPISYFNMLLADPRITLLQILNMQRPLEVARVYVPLRISEERQQRYDTPLSDEGSPKSTEDDPDVWIEEERQRRERRVEVIYDPEKAISTFHRSVIMGDPGAGKTTLLRHLAIMAAQGSIAGMPSLLPIYIELQSFVRSGLHDLLDFVSTTWEEAYAFPARQHLEQALGLAQEIGSRHWVRTVTGSLARVYFLQQDFTKTEAVLTAALEADAAMQTIGQRLVWATRAELALARGDPGLALDITERLIASAANLSDEHVIPRLWKLRGEALAALGRLEEAENTLRAAQEAAQAQGLRPLLWRIYVALGKLYQTQARGAEAEQAFSPAQLLIEALAANLPDERVREHFLSQATAMLPRSPLL